MTDNAKQFNLEIDKALSDKDFEFLFSLFTKNNFSATDLLIFYKRKIDNPFSFPEFWKSELPHFHLKAILENSIKVSFFKSYFEKDQNCSDALNEHLLILSREDFIKYFKLWSTYKNLSFFESFRKLSFTNSSLERLVHEFDIISKADTKICIQQEQDEHFFLQFCFDEVVVAFLLYYQAIKSDKRLFGNKSFETTIVVALINELNRVFNLFKENSKVGNYFIDNESLQKEFQKNGIPYTILGSISNANNQKYKLFSDIIGRLIYRNIQKKQIQLYLNGFANFENVLINSASLRTNSNFRTFQINNNKSVPEEYYFFDVQLESISRYRPQKAEIKSYLKSLAFYGVPKVIETPNNQIEIKKVLTLIRHFSIFKGPIDEKDSLELNQGDETFIKLFGSNESISLFDYETLVNSISEYFSWIKQETESILSFLSFDITSDFLPHLWLERPFVRYEHKVLWLGSFNKGRRWDNILLNKLKNENPNMEYSYFVKKTEKDIKAKLPRILELKIEQLFIESGFKTLSGVWFKSSNGQKSDFDLLAYKDKFLFIGEVKSGKRSDDYSDATYYENVRLEGCAAEQLEKCIFRVNEDWGNIKIKLAINEDIEISDVEIVPLIITDYFEGDLKLYKSKFRKVSFLELEVLFKNRKKELLEIYLFSKSYTDAYNSNLRQDRKKIDYWDLWDGHNSLDVRKIVNNIDENNIWKEIEATWKFDDLEFKLAY